MAQHFLNPAKTHFLCVSGKKKTKNIFDKNILKGGHFLGRSPRGPLFGRVGKPKSPPPAINNEQSLTRLQITNFHHFLNSEITKGGVSIYRHGGYDFGGGHHYLIFILWKTIFSMTIHSDFLIAFITYRI